MIVGFVVGCGGGDDAPDAANEADMTAAASASQLVLTYQPVRKAEMIKDNVFKAGDFTGNDVLVKDARTKIDIAVLLPETDTTVPDRICYRGKPADVKKILEAMIANTDGNGDHILKEGSKVDPDASGKTWSASP